MFLSVKHAFFQQKHTDPVTKELPDVLTEPCDNLEKELQNIVDLTNELKGTS